MRVRGAWWVPALALSMGGCGDPGLAATHGAVDGGSSTSDSTSSSAHGSGPASGSGEPDPERDPPPEPEAPPPDLGSGDVPLPQAPQFVDVTLEAGLEFEHGEFLIPPFCSLDNISSDPSDTGDYCLPERFMGSAAVGDYDGDGWPDVYITRMNGLDRLMRNRGDGTFTDVALEVGLDRPLFTGGAAWLDIEGDGDLDLMLNVVGETRNYLYVNDGHGHFDEQAKAHGLALDFGLVRVGTSIAVGDYDLDGYLDLFFTEWRSTVALGEGSGHNRLLHNLGATSPGHFEDMTEAVGIDLQAVAEEVGAPPGAWAFAPAFVDLDGDHYPELAIASDYGTSRLYWNDGAGGFDDLTLASGVGTDGNGMGSAFGDIDGDGDMDWFVSSIWSLDLADLGNRMYRNEGDRSFSDVTDAFGVRNGGWGWGAALFDADLDADLDLALVGGWPGTVFAEDPLRLWIDGVGAGPWLEVAEARGLEFARNGRGLVPLDYDRDGDLDLLVIANTEIPALFRNDIEEGSWLEVRAKGPAGNSRGVGVEVRVQTVAGGPTQLRHIGVGSHFFGHAEAAAYFGLGPGEAPLHRVELYWPVSGQTRVYEAVPRDQVLLASPSP